MVDRAPKTPGDRALRARWNCDVRPIVCPDAETTSCGFRDIAMRCWWTGWIGGLLIKLDEIRKRYPEIEYVERNVQPEHVHLVGSFPPKYSIAKVG